MIELAERLVGNVTPLIQSVFETETEISWSDSKHHKVKGCLMVFNDAVILTKTFKNKEKILRFVEPLNVKVVPEESKGDKLVLSIEDTKDKKSIKQTIELIFSKSTEANRINSIINKKRGNK